MSYTRNVLLTIRYVTDIVGEESKVKSRTAADLVGGVRALRARVAAPGGRHAARRVRARELPLAARRALRRACGQERLMSHTCLFYIYINYFYFFGKYSFSHLEYTYKQLRKILHIRNINLQIRYTCIHYNLLLVQVLLEAVGPFCYYNLITTLIVIREAHKAA